MIELTRQLVKTVIASLTNVCWLDRCWRFNMDGNALWLGSVGVVGVFLTGIIAGLIIVFFPASRDGQDQK
jgi:hypothetical protein